MHHPFYRIHSSPRLTLALLFWSLATFSLLAQTPVFLDRFENGTVSNSDTFTNFWTPATDTYSSVTESGGQLIITAGDTSTYAGVIAPRISSGTPQHEWNFFRRPLRFSADVNITGTVAAQSHLRFELLGNANSAYPEEDVIAVILKADKTVSLSVKRDQPNASVENVGKLINNVTLAGIATRFELTVNSTDYTLVVYYAGGSGASTFSGLHGLSAARWGIDGKSCMQFEVVRNSSSGAGQITTASVDNFRVESIEPAVLFEDHFNNGIAADSTSESAIWTSTLPFASTIAEVNGSLVQTSTSTGLDFVQQTTTTPVQSRFNFFDQQLRIRTTVSLSGTTSTSRQRMRFALASQANTTTNANDAFVVSAHGDNNVMLSAKMDASGVSPEDLAQAANKYPFNGSSADASVYLGSAKFSSIDLAINSTRYRLTGSYEDIASGVNTRGSNTSRFSGQHQLLRSKWGANGDSALMLESIRASETTAGTSTQTQWENMRVETDSSRILAEPFWTFTATYSTTTGTESGSFRLWIPSTEPVIRGIVFIGPGDGSDYRYLAHDLVAQETARAMGFGLIGYTTSARMNLLGNDTAKIKAAVQEVLNRAAAVSGRPEISNVPLAIAGFSRGAFDSCYLVRNWPERMITFVPYCGGEWSNATLTAAAKKVPGLFVPGSIDTNPATNPYLVQNMFTWWRSQGAQVAYCVNWNVGHNTGGNQAWEAGWAWIAEVTKLRYPRPMVPSTTAAAGTFPTLVTLSDNAGWLGDRTTFTAANTTGVTNAFTTISPYASYAGAASTASWLPNETTARIYRAMTSTDLVVRSAIPTHSPVRIASPALFADSVSVGTSVPIEIDPRDFDNTNALASVDFYDGSTWLGALTTGPLWRWTFTPSAGTHALTVVATDILGNKRDAFRLLTVIPADFPPMTSPQSLPAYANTSTSGSGSAIDPEGKAVTYAIAQAPLHGTATINATTGVFTYRSVGGYTGTDTFTYTANDGVITSEAASVNVNVTLGPVTSVSSLTANPGTNTGEIVLSWSAAEGAASYQIEVSMDGGASYNLISTVNAATLSYVYTAAQWQTYQFRVKGLNASYSGSYSAIASTSPYVAPNISNWRLINFGSSSAIPGVSGDLDQPLDDGVTNLLRYALGYHLHDSSGNALRLSPTNLPYVQEQPINGTDYLTCTFTRNKSATDLVFVVEVANDLNGPWTSLDPLDALNQASVSDNSPRVGIETIVVKDTQPIGTTSRRFMRVRVSHP